MEKCNKFFVDVRALDTIKDGSKNSKFSILELIMLKLLFVSCFNFDKKLHFFLFVSIKKIFETPKIERTAHGNPAPEPKSSIFPSNFLQKTYN